MTEREMRAALQAYCAELDAERARQASHSRWRQALLPAALGAGLLLGGCAAEPINLPYLGPMPDFRHDQRVDQPRVDAPREKGAPADAGSDRLRDRGAPDGRKDK